MPLPFTPFEEYMFLDDSPSYPMDSFRLLHFTGSLDIRLLADSIADVIQRQPMLRSIVKKAGRFRFVWDESEVPPSAYYSEEVSAAGYPSVESINLFKEPGFKVYATDNETGFSILLQFHHSVSDGIGEMEIVGDILTEYANKYQEKTLNPKPFKRREVNPALLPLRGKSGLTLYKYFRYYFDTAITTRQLLLKQPAPLVPDVSGENNSAEQVPPLKDTPKFPAVIAAELTPKETKYFFRQAKDQKITVNDLLVHNLFLTLFDWRRQNISDKGNPLLRISVPMNLRTEKHQGIPASNTVTMVFLDRRPRSGLNKEKLLRSVHREMEWIKRTEQKHVLLFGLRLCRMFPGGIAWAVKRKRCRATAVLSNLGRIFKDVPLPRNEEGKIKAGAAILESIDASPPIRHGTQISFSALTYADRLRLILRYDAKMMTAQQADDLLKMFIQKIKAA
ncbi:MAG: condensation domain-containing protein [Planctomycetaceae bacterium]|jgi:NRPS condensation-like uncharacterized protein|nr:condensation domain-containing protein [Planctomycetaceae bacterium]